MRIYMHRSRRTCFLSLINLSLLLEKFNPEEYHFSRFLIHMAVIKLKNSSKKFLIDVDILMHALSVLFCDGRLGLGSHKINHEIDFHKSYFYGIILYNTV